jgi:6-phosphogluconolactonase
MKNPEQACAAAAGILTRTIAETLKQKAAVVLAVPGGRGAVQTLEKLRSMGIPWSKVHIFMADERRVPPDDPLSNYRTIKEALISPLIASKQLPPSNAHPFVLQDNDVPASLQAYQNELDRLGGSCDIVLLSAGEDGHIASLFPGHPGMEDGSKGYIRIDNAPKEPPARISMSKKLIMRAGTAVLLFTGDHKRAAYQNFCNTEIAENECPAKIVLKIPGRYILTGF